MLCFSKHFNHEHIMKGDDTAKRVTPTKHGKQDGGQCLRRVQWVAVSAAVTFTPPKLFSEILNIMAAMVKNK